MKKDTASCDIVHGSSRSEINGETIMRRSTVGNKDSEETFVRRSTVVKKDTASCDVVHGSSRSEINGETIMRRSTVVKSDNSAIFDVGSTKERGFQHVYKSRNTTSSCRVQVAYNLSVQYGCPRSKQAVKRDKAKKKKIDCLQHISSSPQHALCKSFFLSSRPIIYSGTLDATAILPHNIGNPIVLMVTEHLQVVDTISGARLELASCGDTVFTLIPRQAAIDKLTHVNKTIISLYALEDAQTKAEVRGKKRVTIAETDGRCTTVGLKPNRGTPDITESWPKKLSVCARKNICNLMTRYEEVAKGYIPSNAMRGLQIAQFLVDWPEIDGSASQPIWGSLACGKNYYLNSHLDDDFFYSLTTIASEFGLQEDVDKYRMDAKVCNYFTFAEQGIAVALRPGDMLIFNPRYHHCLSSYTDSYRCKDVFCLSLYLKTAIVGGNDNSQP